MVIRFFSHFKSILVILGHSKSLKVILSHSKSFFFCKSRTRLIGVGLVFFSKVINYGIHCIFFQWNLWPLCLLVYHHKNAIICLFIGQCVCVALFFFPPVFLSFSFHFQSIQIFFRRVHATLHLAVLVGRSVGPSVNPSVTFLKLWLFRVF